MSGDARPSLAMQAARVRDLAAREPNPVTRAEAEAAAATLQFCADNPAVLRACAYFLKAAPWMADFLKDNPDVKIAAVRGPMGAIERHGN